MKWRLTSLITFLFALAIVTAIILGPVPCVAQVHDGAGDNSNDSRLIMFYGRTCPYCEKERKWLETTIRPKYPDLIIEEYETKLNRDLYERMCEEYDTIPSGVPRTFVRGKVFIGFSSEGELIYLQGYKAYRGCKNQIENAIVGCLNNNGNCPMMVGRAIETSGDDPRVRELVAGNSKCISTAVFINDTYLVGWWSPDRLKSDLYYPNVLVYVDAKTGMIIGSEIPTGPVEGLDKPIQSMNWIHASVLLVMMVYLISYLVLRERIGTRYWVGGFATIVIAAFFIFIATTPEEMIEKIALGFPFPLFVFTIALADGFNPCAFTVLIVLLSLLTHTKSRKMMGLIGSVFIFTSGTVYFIFIMLIILAISWLGTTVGGYEDILWKLIGLVVVVAGIINLKDFFFFGKGVSLGISKKQRGTIFGKAGKIVRNVGDAKTKRALALAILGVVVLAVFVNLVELGCTAMLPTVYTKAVENKCLNGWGEDRIVPTAKCFPAVMLYTVFYCLVYILPLFAILGNFIYSFRSDRLSEKQGRTLKLVGGIIMLILGAILILKPELLMFS